MYASPVFCAWASPFADTLRIETFDHFPPAGWWSVSTAADVAWLREGGNTPSPDPNPAWYLQNDANAFENFAILTTSTLSVSPSGGSAVLSLELDCILEGAGSLFQVEAWDGREWKVLLQQTQSLTGNWTCPIDGYLNPDFRIKFTYQCAPYAIARIRIGDVLLSHAGSAWGKNPHALQVRIFSNPFVEEIALEYVPADPEAELALRLVDAQGQVLISERHKAAVPGNRITLPAAGLPSGRYFLLLHEGHHHAGLCLIKH